MTGRRMRALLAWLRAGDPHGIPRADLLAPALLRPDLTESEVNTIVAALALRAGHSVADPVHDEDICRIVSAWTYAGADEAELYRVREAMRREGRALVSHA